MHTTTPTPFANNKPVNNRDTSLLRFCEHFAAAYGALWFGLFVLAVTWRTNLDAGLFGFFWFPLVALSYALMRYAFSSGPASEVERLRQYVRLLEAAQQTTSRTL